MKCYIISNHQAGGILLLTQSLVKGQLVEITPEGPFDAGNASKKTEALALAILKHYYNASENDAPALAEAQRKVKVFLDAFLLPLNLPVGGKYEVSSEVVDKFFALLP